MLPAPRPHAGSWPARAAALRDKGSRRHLIGPAEVEGAYEREQAGRAARLLLSLLDGGSRLPSPQSYFYGATSTSCRPWGKRRYR